MNTYCQIYNNKAWWIFQAETMPEFHPDIIIKDITNLNPQPKEGWNYDSATDTFTAPVIPTPTLDQVKAAQTQLIMSAYVNTLSAGFTSSATGTAIQYPYNMAAELSFDEEELEVQANALPYPTNVYDINGNTIAIPDATTMGKLLGDVANFKKTTNTKMHNYIQQIIACTDVASVLTKVWS